MVTCKNQGSCLTEGGVTEVVEQDRIPVCVAIVVAPFGLLGMQMEGVFGDALELGEPDLGDRPEAFDAVDVHGAFGELIVGVNDPEVAVSEIDEAVVARPAVGVDDRSDIDPP